MKSPKHQKPNYKYIPIKEIQNIKQKSVSGQLDIIIIRDYSAKGCDAGLENVSVKNYCDWRFICDLVFGICDLFDFPETRRNIEQAGYPTISLDVSEFEKLDGGLSCLSLRF